METKLNNRTKISDFACMLPAFIFTLSVLLVQLHQFQMPLTDIYWTDALDSTVLSDLFCYWKSLAILVAGGLAVIVMVIAYFKDRIQYKKSFLYIPTLVYVAFVLISMVFSKYKYFAIHGMQEHFEGTFVLLSYMLLVFFLFNALDSERRVKMTLFCTLGVVFLLGIFGLTQAAEHDFFATIAGQKIITPYFSVSQGMRAWDMIDLLIASGQKVYDFAFTEGQVYQTVYNINYVSFYLTLLIPVSAALFIYYGTHEKKNKIVVAALFLVLYGLDLYNFFAANSASGYLGLVASIIAALIIFRKGLKKWFRALVCLVIISALIMGLLAGRWIPEIKKALAEELDRLTTVVYADDYSDVKQNFNNLPASIGLPIDLIETYDDHFDFGINGAILRVTRDNENSSYIITDGDNNQLYLKTIEGQDGVFQILDERFHDYLKISLRKDTDNNTYVVVNTRYADWLFRYDGNKFLYHNKVGKDVSLFNVPHSSLIKDYNAGTGRGRIWATTIPMLRQYLFAGAGADTYAFVFPQNDYVTIYNTNGVSYGDYWLSLVTDKAHSLYLQYWVNTGLISLLAWLMLVGFYLVGAVKYFRKRGFVDFCDFVNGGIFCGIIGFLATAFFNDGSVNTMPMFYTMLGTGLAINIREKWPIKDNTEEKPAVSSMPEI